jgi:ribokinase
MSTASSAACDVVVIGSSNMDMVVRCPELPLPGQTILGSDFVMNPGGKGANQAYAAAKMGARTQLVTRVGNDVFAEASCHSFCEVGLGTDYVVKDESTPSGVALIYVDEHGENNIVVAGANRKLSPPTWMRRAIHHVRERQVTDLQLEISGWKRRSCTRRTTWRT